jgi:DNA repair protein RadC
MCSLRTAWLAKSGIVKAFTFEPPAMPSQPAASPERPRERLLAHGAQSLTTPELLAIVLRTGIRGASAIALGRQLIEHFNGLRGLLDADLRTLMAQPGLGLAKACELLAIHELNRRALAEELRLGQALDQPQRVKHYCIATLGHLKVEHCFALYLDSQYRLITSEELARGTLTQASVYPREVVKASLRHHAAALILAHNHPSGVSEPSQADLALTRHLKQALALVDIRLLDHLVVTANSAISLAERGQI